MRQAATLRRRSARVACGNYGVNTMQPAFQPYSPGTVRREDPPLQTNPTIGDRLTAAGVDWAWYAGGWANANGDVGEPGLHERPGRVRRLRTGCSDPYVEPGRRATGPRCPDNLFQYHHQPFNYYATFTTQTQAGLDNRAAHLQDEVELPCSSRTSSDKKDCNLKPVSFIKPIGEENEHPGYASESNGNEPPRSTLLKSIEGSKCAKDTMVVVTYDEFGGQWDHVSPPGQGNNNGPHDVWGPGRASRR